MDFREVQSDLETDIYRGIQIFKNQGLMRVDYIWQRIGLSCTLGG